MKLKIARILTESYVVDWHLKNTLTRISCDFEVCVVGQGVSKYKNIYPDVYFFDIKIDRKRNVLSDLSAFIALCRFFINYKPDIIHSIMPKAGLLSALAGFCCRIPIRIHTFTGQTWATRIGFSRLFYYSIDRLINFLNTSCLTDSPSQSAFLLSRKISVAGGPLPVLLKGSLSGVDTLRFDVNKLDKDSMQLRAELNLNADNFVFAFIARKTLDKGAVDILKAFSTVTTIRNKCRLLFIGPDEDGEIKKLRDASPELFINVIDFGHVKNPELYLAVTDVLCLPSYREGFGSIVIDAAAMYVPAIGSRIPGLTDSIVDKETGLLFSVGNLSELITHMLAYAENPMMCKEAGRRAKARVDEFFTAERLYVALKDYYLNCAIENDVTNRKMDSLT